MTPDPDVNELEHEIRHNPRAFAVRFVGMADDVAEIKTETKETKKLVQRGAWLAATVLLGVIVDLALRLQEAGAKPAPAQAAEAAVTFLVGLVT